MRLLISSVRLVGESQVLGRCIVKFATQYFECVGKESGLKSSDVAVTLAYSILMLNTDAHNKVIKVY